MIVNFDELSDKEVADEINKMIHDGEFPVLTGMRIVSGGGHGTVLATGTMPFINGQSLVMMGTTQVNVPMYAMGCPGCPHNVFGFFTTGSTTRFCNGVPIATMNSVGLVTGGCGPADFHPTEALFVPVTADDVVAMPR